MKKKTVIIILSVVGGLALLAGLGAHFIISLKADREAMRKQIVEVKDVYKVFSGHIDTFNEIRNNLYSSVNVSKVLQMGLCCYIGFNNLFCLYFSLLIFRIIPIDIILISKLDPP